MTSVSRKIKLNKVNLSHNLVELNKQKIIKIKS